MKSVSVDLMKAVERLKHESNDFTLFMQWIDQSFFEKVNESLEATRDSMQICQGYLRALNDIRTKVANSRETLDRSNRNRDTL